MAVIVLSTACTSVEQARVTWPAAAELPAATGPGKAHEWRRLAWKDENGQIDPDALRAAFLQRRANVGFWEAKAVALGRPGTPVSKAGLDPLAWQEHGPNNVGGRTRSLLVHPGDTTRLWAGAVSGGLWHSTDRGATWTPINDWWTSLAIGCLAMDPHDPDVMYAGTGEGFFNGDAIGGAGIFRTIDGGATWTQLPSTASWNTVCRIAISPDDGNVLLAGTRYGGIQRSANGGDTWTTVRWAQGCFDADFDPTDGRKAVAHVIDFDSDWYHAALYSTDGGITWTESAPPLDRVDGFGSRIEVAYAPTDPAVVYASVAIDGGKIYRSTDGGRSYALLTGGDTSGASWYANPLWVEPINADVLLTGGYTIFGSIHGGQNLFPMSNGYIMTEQPHPDIHFFTNDPDYDGETNRRIFVCTDGGLWMADDLYSASPVAGWTRRDLAYRTTQFYGAAGDGPIGVLVGGTQDNGTLMLSTDDDQAHLTFGGDGGFCAIDPSDPDYMYGEYVALQIHRSTDGGLSAGYIFQGIGDAGSDANFIAPFILDPNDPNTMLAGGRSLWRSTDVKMPSPSWSAIKGPGSDRISAIAVAPGDSDIIWVAQNNGEVYRTDNGTAGLPAWTAVDDNGVTANPLPNRYVTRLLIDPGDHEKVYAAFGGFAPNNLQVTFDGGTTWLNITGPGTTGLPNVPIRGIARHPELPNWIYVGTEVGVFASDGGGVTWTASDFGPAAVSVDELVFLHGSTRLLAATHGRGLWTVETGPAGDLDGDGVVGILDFLALLAAWGPCPSPFGCPADLDGDGVVGILDFLILLGNWG